MASCTISQADKIMEVVRSFRGKNRCQAEEFAERLSPKGLCLTLHAMRRWYSGWDRHNAKKLLEHRDILKSVMDLEPNFEYGLYRGFKVVRGTDLAQLSPGDTITLPVTRNGGASSWTTKPKLANRFSGPSKSRVGLIVKLVGGREIKPFIAPPQYSVSWFNDLYKKTMGESFRFKEYEFAIWSKTIDVEIIRVKT